MKTILNVRTNKEVLGGLQKIAKVLSATSRMEVFIKDICGIVLAAETSGGAPQQLEVLCCPHRSRL